MKGLNEIGKPGIFEGTRDDVQGAPDMFYAGHELELYSESEG